MNLYQFIATKNFNPDKRAEIMRDYRVIVILQALIIFSALILKEGFAIIGFTNTTAQMVRDTIFLSLGGLYVYFLWDFLRNLMRFQIVITFLSVLILGSYILALYAINPFYDFIDGDIEKRPYLLFIHSVLFLVEATVIYFTILDLFEGRKKFDEKLWGSACVFFMIGISFGSMYDLISIASPGAMGVPVTLGLESYTLCIYFSLTTIGGRDALENAIPLVQNIAVLEAVWANLFSLLLVGRLLSTTDSE
ncbi:MAG: hypothetical protein U0U66_09590 [Cytophagaceae bacterium]